MGFVQFVVQDLRSLSDSGIYETLVLERVIDAHAQEGIFHHNIFLTLELSSPYFAGNHSTSIHEVMVMDSLEDGVWSFAIDEFPVMDEDAIEAFWIQRVR